MSSTASPYGLRPIRRVDGLPYAGQMRQVKIASGYATSIFIGDIVAVHTDGTIVLVNQAGTNAAPFPAGTLGVFMGYMAGGDPTNPIFTPVGINWKSGTVDANAMAFVVDDPNVAFLAQANGALAQADLHTNIGISYPGDVTGFVKSGVALDTATKAATDTIALKVIDFYTGPGSKVGDAYTDVIVKFNPKSHAYLNGTGVA